MRLSTQTSSGVSHGLTQAETVRLLANAGFDAFDLSIAHPNAADVYYGPDWKDPVAQIRKVMEETGIVCNQAHGPYPTLLDASRPGAEKWGTPAVEYNSHIFDWVVRSIQIAGVLGAYSIIIHPIHHLPFRDNEAYLKDMNMDFYRSLIPVSKQTGVKIALENMWQRDKKRNYIVDSACASPESFCDYLDTLADDCFVACLDLGHVGLCGREPAELIHALGRDRLKALHVHDTDFIHDSHTMPYCGKQDWNGICNALAEIGYTGDFTFEADAFLHPFPTELLPEASRFMCAVGRHLVAKIQK